MQENRRAWLVYDGVEKINLCAETGFVSIAVKLILITSHTGKLLLKFKKIVQQFCNKIYHFDIRQNQCKKAMKRAFEIFLSINSNICNFLIFYVFALALS
jgi:hypothetical protein